MVMGEKCVLHSALARRAAAAHVAPLIRKKRKAALIGRGQCEGWRRVRKIETLHCALGPTVQVLSASWKCIVLVMARTDGEGTHTALRSILARATGEAARPESRSIDAVAAILVRDSGRSRGKGAFRAGRGRQRSLRDIRGA